MNTSRATKNSNLVSLQSTSQKVWIHTEVVWKVKFSSGILRDTPQAIICKVKKNTSVQIRIETVFIPTLVGSSDLPDTFFNF